MGVGFITGVGTTIGVERRVTLAVLESQAVSK
jgi:hypothetical protein